MPGTVYFCVECSQTDGGSTPVYTDLQTARSHADTEAHTIVDGYHGGTV